jgi:hypothetical protein
MRGLGFGFILAGVCGGLFSCNQTLAPETQAIAVSAASDISQRVVQSVCGSAHLIGEGTDRTVTLSILKHADGSVDGWYRALTRGPGGAQVTVRMECLHVQGNRAWAGGTIVEAANPANIGRPVSIRVVDNGEGEHALPDELGGIWEYHDCGSMPDLDTRGLLIGNISIKG